MIGEEGTSVRDRQSGGVAGAAHVAGGSIRFRDAVLAILPLPLCGKFLFLTSLKDLRSSHAFYTHPNLVANFGCLVGVPTALI